MLNTEIRKPLLLTLLMFSKGVIAVILKKGLKIKELKVIRLKEGTLTIKINV